MNASQHRPAPGATALATAARALPMRRARRGCTAEEALQTRLPIAGERPRGGARHPAGTLRACTCGSPRRWMPCSSPGSRMQPQVHALLVVRASTSSSIRARRRTPWSNIAVDAARALREAERRRAS